MRVFQSTTCDKQFAKLPTGVQEAYIDRMRLFMKDRSHALLHEHALKGEWTGFHSINVTGDYRAVYFEVAHDTFEFVAIGTHHTLFGK